MAFPSSNINNSVPFIFHNTFHYSSDEESDRGLLGVMIEQSLLCYDPCKSDLWQKVIPNQSSIQIVARSVLSERPFNCPIETCKGIKFKSKGGLTKHIRAKHLKPTISKKKPFKCPIKNCKHRVFSQKKDLKLHIINAHHEIQEIVLAGFGPYKTY